MRNWKEKDLGFTVECKEDSKNEEDLCVVIADVAKNSSMTSRKGQLMVMIIKDDDDDDDDDGDGGDDDDEEEDEDEDVGDDVITLLCNDRLSCPCFVIGLSGFHLPTQFS